MSKSYYDLYNLQILFSNSEYRDYYMDVDGQVWSDRKKGKTYPILLKNQKTLKIKKCSGQIISVDLENLRKEAFQNKFFQDFVEKKSKIQNFCGENVMNDSMIKKGQFIIAAIDSDTNKICFSSNPKVHTTITSARTEVERLVKEFPGKTFAYFECAGLAKSQGISWF